MVKQNYGLNISHEKIAISYMIAIYCRKKHSSAKGQLCDECEELKKYAISKLTFCRYGEQKPTCEKCPTHCYHKKYKQQIKNVMRFSGPRMILYHPIIAIRHLYKNHCHHNQIK